MPRLTIEQKETANDIGDIYLWTCLDTAVTISTSHVERNNLTVRTFLKRFNRLTLGFSKKLENLEAAIAMFVAFYNYCWRPREKGKSGRLKVTPAMAAGLVGELWSVETLFDHVMGQKNDWRIDIIR